MEESSSIIIYKLWQEHCGNFIQENVNFGIHISRFTLMESCLIERKPKWQVALQSS